MSKVKRPFAVLSKDKASGSITYEADFWEGPVFAGDEGRYVRKRFSMTLGQARANVAPSCSFYSELMRAFA